jgi:predicted secreted protein with PEFG-CTERM motif
MVMPKKTITLLAAIFVTVIVFGISSANHVAGVDVVQDSSIKNSDVLQGNAVVIKAPALVVEGPSTEETTVAGLSSDGKIRVEITSSNPALNEVMSIDIKFRDSSGGSLKQHANYDIVATQNGKEILSLSKVHVHEGHNTHNTTPLKSDDSVDIRVTLLGFGLPNDQANWTGPAGEVLYFNVVPEFGTIAVMILAVAITSIIAISAKSRLGTILRT